MPWATLTTGCVAGTVVLAVVGQVARGSHWSLGQGAVRLAFLPAVAALTFVPRDWFRPVTQAACVPAWTGQVGRVLLAAPVLAATGWAQLLIVNRTVTIRTGPLAPGGHQAGAYPPEVYPLIAQLVGWCAVAVAIAACVERSRYADLAGAIAAPVCLVAIALAWYAPVSGKVLVEPPATARGVTVAWYAITFAAFALTWAAVRDRWHRYTRRP